MHAVCNISVQHRNSNFLFALKTNKLYHSKKIPKHFQWSHMIIDFQKKENLTFRSFQTQFWATSIYLLNNFGRSTSFNLLKVMKTFLFLLKTVSAIFKPGSDKVPFISLLKYGFNMVHLQSTISITPIIAMDGH